MTQVIFEYIQQRQSASLNQRHMLAMWCAKPLSLNIRGVATQVDVDLPGGNDAEK